MTNQELVQQIGTNKVNVFIVDPSSVTLTNGGHKVELGDVETGKLYLLSAQGIDYANATDPNQLEQEAVQSLLSPSEIIKDEQGGVCIIAGKTVFSTINFSKEMIQAQIDKENKELAKKFRNALDIANKSNNNSYFISICESYGMYFDDYSSRSSDSLLLSVYNKVHDYLKEHNIDPSAIKSISREELGLIFASAKEEYDLQIERTAKYILRQLHAEQKPIVLIPYMNSSSVQSIKDLSSLRLPAEISARMDIPVTPLAGPPSSLNDRINLAYRMVDNIHNFGGATIIFSTEDGVFVHCGNKGLADVLNRLQAEYLTERHMALPEIGGTAGVRKEFAEYRNIEYPAILQEFVAVGNSLRYDALEAVQNIFEDYNKQGVPIFVSALETCFVSDNGAHHNYPVLMMPGDVIRPVMGEDNIHSIGDTNVPVPTEVTVIGVHTNEHGSMVITDGGVFAIGGIGENIIDGIKQMNREKIEMAHFANSQEVEAPENQENAEINIERN